MRSILQEEFIKKSKKLYGNKYDYSLVHYKNMKEKVIIIYNNCKFYQSPENHLLGKLCEKRYDTERFIFEAIKIHGDKYDYSKTEFKNMRNHVIIIYNNIEYLQSPSKHLMGKCPEKNRKLRTTKEFIEESNKIWKNKYDYSLVDYKGSHIEVLIKFENKIYRQKPAQHLLGYNCERNTIKNQNDFIQKAKEKHGDKYDYSILNYTGIENKIDIIYKGITYSQKAGAHLYAGLVERKIERKTTEEFIEISNQIHDFKFNYDKSVYINNSCMITITCMVHGDFIQYASSHMSGTGCPHCRESKGEKSIAKFLDKYKILYTRQKKFDNCKGIKHKLPFDFYIASMNSCIEFDGIQHFKPIKQFGGIEAFEATKINDKIKSDYCEENFINLVRIKYDEIDDIWNILWSHLGSSIRRMKLG